MIRWLMTVSVLVGAATTVLQDAGPTGQDAKRLARISDLIRDAGSLYKDKEFEESGKKIIAAQALLIRAADTGHEDIRDLLEKEHGRIAKAHQLLTAEGIKMPALQPLPSVLGAGDPPATDESNTDMPSPGEPAADEPADASGDPAGAVSFQNQVRTVLVRHCGNCHVRSAKGDFSMATFAKLMAESPSGDPVVAGNAGDSLIVQMMESGDMPPRGRKVPQQEIALIKTWIQQGAAFDGPDQTAPLGNGGGQGRGR